MEADERFKDIYVRYFSRMKKFAEEYVLSEYDAENIVQDVFTDLWHRREILNYDVNLVALLFTSIKNRCIDFLRKRVVMNKAHQAIKEEYEMTLGMKLASLEAFNDSLLTEHDIERVITELINKLPPGCRDIFVKSRIEGMKQSEIAEELGISVKTVENQMTIAYRKMRKELKNYFPLLLFMTFPLLGGGVKYWLSMISVAR